MPMRVWAGGIRLRRSECFGSPRTNSIARQIPKGLNHPAQGWPMQRGLPWVVTTELINPVRVASPRPFNPHAIPLKTSGSLFEHTRHSITPSLRLSSLLFIRPESAKIKLNQAQSSSIKPNQAIFCDSTSLNGSCGALELWSIAKMVKFSHPSPNHPITPFRGPSGSSLIKPNQGIFCDSTSLNGSGGALELWSIAKMVKFSHPSPHHPVTPFRHRSGSSLIKPNQGIFCDSTSLNGSDRALELWHIGQVVKFSHPPPHHVRHPQPLTH